MCGRFALTLPKDAVLRHFRAEPWPGLEGEIDRLDRPRPDIRPTDPVWAIARDPDGARRLAPMRWGFLPAWAKGPKEGPPLINARAETIAEKPAFRDAVRATRCLVPADAFYEWRDATPAGARKPAKEPHRIAPARAEDAPLAFAGVWRRWRGADAAGMVVEIASVAIVTCAANVTMAALHERLPVAIAPADYGSWLGEEGPGAARLLRAPAEDFYAHAPIAVIGEGAARLI